MIMQIKCRVHCWPITQPVQSKWEPWPLPSNTAHIYYNPLYAKLSISTYFYRQFILSIGRIERMAVQVIPLNSVNFTFNFRRKSTGHVRHKQKAQKKPIPILHFLSSFYLRKNLFFSSRLLFNTIDLARWIKRKEMIRRPPSSRVHK